MWMNPILLAGLAGALAPLVLHLLSQSRGRSVPWAAMMFLNAPDGKPDRSPIRRMWFLLGLRMLMIASLAIALARPILPGRIDPRDPRPSTMVLVVDCSSSMARRHAGHSRLEMARDAARQALWSVEPGSRVALVALGHEARVVTEPTSNLQDIARELDRLTVIGGEADVSRGLDAAKSIFEKAEPGPRELFLIADRQPFNWDGVDPGSNALNWLSQPGLQTRFFVVPVGARETESLSILPIDISNYTLVRGVPQTIEIRVRNFSPVPRAGIDVSLLSFSSADLRARVAEMKKIASARIDLPAGGVGVARIPLSLDSVGSMVLSARIESSPLEPGSRRDIAVEVIPPVQTLVLTGDDPEDRDRSADFLRIALSPRKTAGFTGDGAEVAVESIDNTVMLDFTRYSVFFIVNPPLVDDYLASRLEQAAYRGAGVVLIPGNLTRVDNFNQKFWRFDSGISPAQLKMPVDGAVSLLGLDLQHPAFSFVRPGDSMPSSVFHRYFQTVPGFETQVLATFSTGEPFLMERSLGRGKIMLVASPPDPRWNLLPRNGFFLPWVQSMTRSLASSTAPVRNFTVGDSFSVAFDETVDRALVIRDDDLPMINLARVSQVRVSEAQQPGIYRVISWLRGQTKASFFVVSDTPRESDPAVIDDARWTAIGNNLRFIELNPSTQAIGPILSADRRGTELWLHFLLFAAALSVLEQILTRFWSTEEHA